MSLQQSALMFAFDPPLRISANPVGGIQVWQWEIITVARDKLSYFPARKDRIWFVGAIFRISKLYNIG
jgi:hypothetical protein